MTNSQYLITKFNEENTKAFNKNKYNDAECNLAMTGTMKWRMCVSIQIIHSAPLYYLNMWYSDRFIFVSHYDTFKVLNR